MSARRNTMLIVKRITSIDLETEANNESFLLTDLKTLKPATVTIKLKNNIISKENIRTRKINPLSTRFATVVRVDSIGTVNIVSRENSMRKVRKELPNNPIPTFLAHIRLVKGIS